MTEILCMLLPFLLGALLSWLLAGWLARRLKGVATVKKIVEKPVDRIVDNPKHLALISKLENENKEIAGLKTQLAGFQSSSSVKGAKTIDNPEHVKRISTLEAEVATLRKGSKIDLAAAKEAGFSLKSAEDFTAVEGIGPKINDLIHADGVKSFAELANTPVASIQTVLDNAGSNYKIANPGTWPDQASLAANNRWPALKALQDVLIGGVYPDPSKKKANDESAKLTKSATSPAAKSSKPAKKATSSTVDKAAAKAAGFRVKAKAGEDDFTVIEGVGPKINGLIHEAGILTYAALSKTSADTILKILAEAGPRYSLAKPGTWPKQAKMAADNKWEALKAWQDELDGGK